MRLRAHPSLRKSARRLLPRVGFFLWLAVPVLTAALTPASKPQVLRTIKQIYTESTAGPPQSHPVALNAVVTYSDGQWGMLFVRDATGNTFLDVPHGGPTYAPGTLVHIHAQVTTQGGGILISKVTADVLGHGAPPVPLPASLADLDAGANISSLVVTEGVLHPCLQPAGHLCYRLVAGKLMLYVSVRQAPDAAANNLVGAVVRARGVVTSHQNSAGKRDAAQLFMDSLNDFAVLAPPVSMNAPVLPIRAIAPMDADVSIVRQVHIRGRILWRNHGLFLVRDETSAIFVEAYEPTFFQTGDTVDVLGFPAHGRWGLELSDAELRLSLTAMNTVSLAPQELRAKDILGRAYQGWPVKLNARLLGQSSQADETVYQLRDGDQKFRAICLSGSRAGQVSVIPADASVELTGIAWIEPGGGASSAQLTVLLEYPSDIAVRSGEIWLTWQRALGILGFLALCMLVPLLWIKQLRRTLRKQTNVIHQNYASKLQLEARFRRMIERNLAGFFTFDVNGMILECNAAFAHMLGMEAREDLIGHLCNEFEAESGQAASLRQALEEGMLSNWETSMRCYDGAIVHLMMNITPIDIAGSTIYETTAIDITQLRLHQAELQKAKDAAVFDSLNDTLTGLPNRRYLLENLPVLLTEARAKSHILALLFVDLDGFKVVNDSLGHAMGDALLVRVASILRSLVRQGDTLARLGGDEFMVILGNVQNATTAVAVAESLREAVSVPQRVESHVLSIGASIGISIFPSDTLNAEELIHHADCAMYAAKRAGKNRIVRYSQEMGSFAQERLILENQLRTAVAQGEIFLHYQPEFDLCTRCLVRFEALARWTHSTAGAISPLKFIAVAEETGLIHELGAYLLEKACEEALCWQENGRIQVAVNISPLQFYHAGFVDEILEILARTGLDPALLQIEFTESVMLRGSQETEAIMHRLRDAGIQLAVDDFGTGYSNLSYLPELPFDYLKIDGSFARYLGSRPSAEIMMRTLIMMAHNFGMRVIAEGVETEEQLECLRACGADEVQGFFLGRPTAEPRRCLPETFVAK